MVQRSGPISRVLYRVAPATAIHLGARLPGHSTAAYPNPDRRAVGAKRCIIYTASPGLLFGIAPGGVFHAGPCHQDRGALLPHPFTVTASHPKMLRTAVCSLWHCPSSCLAWLLASTLALWSSDFPPAGDGIADPPAAARPTPMNQGHSSKLNPIREPDGISPQGNQVREAARTSLAGASSMAQLASASAWPFSSRGMWRASKRRKPCMISRTAR